MKRNFVAVVDQVKASIPVTLPDGPELKKALIKLQIRAKQSSDRNGHQELWNEGAQLLAMFLGDLDQPWKKLTYAIWAKRR